MFDVLRAPRHRFRRRLCRARLVPRGPGAAAFIFAAALVAGCDRQRGGHDYEIHEGVVKSVNAETGELVVETRPVRRGDPEERAVAGVVTSDTEIYVNDRFAGIDALRAGDTVEIVWYRDPSAPDRVAVSFVYVTRPESAPAPPDLSPAAPPTQPP